MGSSLSVTGETDVGWCAATPPNETTDDDGNPMFREKGFSALDPRAPKRRIHDDPEVQALREHLRLHNGLPGLEMVEPHEIERATRLFFRDGFVVVRNLLDVDRLEELRAASARILGQILDIPGVGGRKYITETARLPHRYSYGTASASRQLLHEPEWAALIDLATATPILKSIFGGPDYLLTGAGGDLCLPGAIEYQTLHSDFREMYELPQARLEQARRVGVKVAAGADGEIEYRARQLIYERTPPRLTLNLLMSDLTWENGPIRQIPGTQTRPGNPPSQTDEPGWMRLSTLVGAPAGAGIFRDLRAWHGATPNVGKEIRAMPNVEYGSSWLNDRYFSPCLPHAMWETLSDHAKAVSRRVVTEPGVWPVGAGTMHPLAGGAGDGEKGGEFDIMTARHLGTFVASTVIALMAASNGAAATQWRKIDTQAGYRGWRTELQHIVDRDGQTRFNHFCVVVATHPAAPPDGAYTWAYVYWREAAKLHTFSESSEPMSDLSLFKSPLDLKTDVVASRSDIQGSTVLVTRSWLRNVLDHCKTAGTQIMVTRSQ